MFVGCCVPGEVDVGQCVCWLNVCRVEDAVKALDASQGKMFFGTKIRVTAHEGISK